MIDFVDLARKSGYLCFDIEFDSNRTHVFANDFAAHGCGFSSLDGNEIVKEYVTDWDRIRHIIEETFGNPDIQIIAHNAKFDLNCLKQLGIQVPDCNIRDTMIAMNLLDDNLKVTDLGLKPTVLREYGHKMDDYKKAASDGMDSERFRKYAEEDVYYELKLYLDLEPMLKPFWRLFTEVLMQAVHVFSDMECFGLHWDIEQAESFYAKLFVARDKLEKQIYSKIGRLNISSPKQLAQRLFKELGYKSSVTKAGKSGTLSVGAKVLDELARKYPVCNWIRAYRTCEKLINTYIEPAYGQWNRNKDKRIHSSYWLTSQTGRTRCSDLNNQNMPARVGSDLGELKKLFDDVKIRKACSVPKGKKLIVVDANQIELRLAGHIMQEKAFIDAYKDWKCFNCGDTGSDRNTLHKCPSCGQAEYSKAWKEKKGFWQGRDLHSEVLELVPEGLREKLNRNHGKALNFAIIYNAGGWRLHYSHPSISPEEWQLAVDNIMALRPNAKAYHRKSETLLRTQGYRDTIFGRRRRIPKSEYTVKGVWDKKKFKHALNQFINAPVQSAGADFGHVFLIKLRKFFIENGWWGTRVKLVNWVHDEVVLEADEEIAELVLQYTVEIMETAVGLDVPIRAEGGIYDNWAEAK